MKQAETYWQTTVLVLVFLMTVGVYAVLGWLWSRLQTTDQAPTLQTTDRASTPSQFPRSEYSVQIIEPLDGAVLQRSSLVDVRAAVMEPDYLQAELYVDGRKVGAEVKEDAKATPWLPVYKNHNVINVQDQLADQDSLLNLYRTLLHLRQENSSLQTGSLELIGDPITDQHILAYTRSGEDQTLLVVINFGVTETAFDNPTDCQQNLLRAGQVTTAEPSKILLSPFSGVLMSN